MDKKLIFIMTIGGDMRVSSSVTNNESLMAIVDVFDRQGVSGHCTWMLNEGDFAFTLLYQDFMKEILKRGDTIGIHDHIDFLKGNWDYDAIKDFCSRSRGRIEGWLETNGYKQEVLSHRFGCGIQHEAARERDFVDPDAIAVGMGSSLKIGAILERHADLLRVAVSRNPLRLGDIG